MATHFADRVVKAINHKNVPACVGLDPLINRLPLSVLQDAGIPITGEGTVGSDAADATIAEAMLAFGREVIRVVAPYVPIIKINIAFFERYHADGVRAYYDLVRCASEAGLIVIGDVKRADIGHSAKQYAWAHLGQSDSAEFVAPDAVTVSPYFGFDGVRPFVEIAREQGRGVFVLVQTSNESAVEVQGLPSSGGSTVAQRVAELVQSWATEEGLLGETNYSCIGAVVSPRDLAAAERIRTLMPNCLFLVPGFGAQGRTAEEVARCFKPDGTGAIVTASRSVIYAFQEARYSETLGNDWLRCIQQACRDFVEAIRTVIVA